MLSFECSIFFSTISKLKCFRNSSLRSLEKYNDFKFFRKFSSKTNKHEIVKVAKRIEKATNILVMTGAGLSTPSGIPDFRSPGTGLYDNLQKYDLPYPEAIFDIQFFMMDPRPFFTLAKELYPGVWYKPNIGHYFLYLLHSQNKLQKLYTQNIDGLESLVGVPDNKLVEAHGTFSAASCTLCGERHDPIYVKKSILTDEVPIICGVGGCKGKVKPDIVFFGEELPEKFWDFHTDVHFTDMLLVIGTSLEVYPFASIADAVSKKTTRILINKETVGSFGTRENDIILKGNLIETIESLASELNWSQELNSMMK